MRSLKGVLFRSVIIGTVLVLVAAGGVLYYMVDAQLLQQMDESLTDKVQMLALSVEEKPYGLEVDLEEMRLEEMEEADLPEYLSINTLSGRSIYRSEDLNAIFVSESSDLASVKQNLWHRANDGRKLRSVTIVYTPEVDDEDDLPSVIEDADVVIDKETAPGDQVIIRLYRDASGHSRFMGYFFIMLVATGLGSIGILSLMVWVAIKRGARPINEIASRIESINDKDLTERLERSLTLKELDPIVQKLNELLERLEQSFNRERCFTSDAAHELRTPLAGLKSTIEVCLAKEREAGDYRRTLQRALEIVRQLDSLIRSLLALARLESGQEKPQATKVNLEKCLVDAWSSCSEAAREKGIKSVFNVHDGSSMVIDREFLTQILEELFENAVYYVDEGGKVTIDLMEEGNSGGKQLKISNTGSKISTEEEGRVFDRFWRGSTSRNDTGVRFGLGLPIVKKFVETVGADINIRSEKGGNFVVTLTLPAG